MRAMKMLGLLLFGLLAAVPVYAGREPHARGHGHGRIGEGHRHRISHTGRHPGHHYGRGHWHHRPHVHRHWPRYPNAWSYGYGWPYSRAYYAYPDGSYTSLGVGFYDDDFSYRASRGNYAANGLLLGALAGAVIGNNSGDLHNNAWLGAGLGAATGYIAGSVAENRARRREAAEAANNVDVGHVYASQAQSQQAATPTVETASTSTASSATATPARTSNMTAANRLFGR